MISVIVPARNAAATIAATLSSLVPDRALIGEILLIDDGSTDGTATAAAAAAARLGLPLEVMRVELSSPGAARNVALARVRGGHVFYIDADDELVGHGLALLHETLLSNPHADLAVGASIHRGSQGDKVKFPGNYSADRLVNARRYLENKVRSITMGSALVSVSATASVRFPEQTSLDEDTCYWAAVLTKASVVTIPAPIVAYNIDEARMTQRFVSEPRKVLLRLSRDLDKLGAHGIDHQVLQRRKAWIALRIARQLILLGRYREAAGMMRAVRAHSRLRHSLKALQYVARIRKGLKSGGTVRPAALESQSPRTLILTVDPAYPPVSGADLRNFQNAAAAAGFGPVSLVSVHPQGEDTRMSDERIRVLSLDVADERRARPVTRRTTAIEVRISSAMLARLLDIMRDFQPDVVLVEGIPLFPVLGQIRPFAPMVILDMHNVESDLAAQVTRNSPGFSLFRASGRSEATRIHALEKRALAAVDRVWVCSKEDRQRLSRQFNVGIPVEVVPNGIPRHLEIPSRLEALPSHEGGFPVMIFVGHLGYAPNVEAAERLALGILPRVRRAFPTARLVLAGRLPKPRVEELALLQGVELVANPADLSAIYRRGHLSVVPLSAGGGTRIKILEAMAWGLPVVATTLAAEGHGFEAGDEIAISDTDEGLAQDVIALCSGAGRLESQRQMAHRKLARDFGAETIKDAVRKGLGLEGRQDMKPMRSREAWALTPNANRPIR